MQKTNNWTKFLNNAYPGKDNKTRILGREDEKARVRFFPHS